MGVNQGEKKSKDEGKGKVIENKKNRKKENIMKQEGKVKGMETGKATGDARRGDI